MMMVAMQWSEGISLYIYDEVMVLSIYALTHVHTSITFQFTYIVEVHKIKLIWQLNATMAA